MLGAPAESSHKPLDNGFLMDAIRPIDGSTKDTSLASLPIGVYVVGTSSACFGLVVPTQDLASVPIGFGFSCIE